MANILVVGSLKDTTDETKAFVKCLGEEIIDQHHCLIGGCLNEFDELIARSAFERLQEHSLEAKERIVSYVIDKGTPVHQYGTLYRSLLPNWRLDPGPGRLHAPEQIKLADIVILVAGSEGTTRAADWARIVNKPLLPVAVFGGAAAELYREELNVFDKKYKGRIDQLQFEKLNQISRDCRKIAQDAVSLARHLTSSREVFVIMSFSDDPKLVDAYESFKEVCSDNDMLCTRIDDASAVTHITPEVLEKIKRSAFVLADLTGERPNVYYELGFAMGQNKPVILTAYEGTALPFDVKDIPTLFWKGQTQLKDQLRDRIGEIVGVSYAAT